MIKFFLRILLGITVALFALAAFFVVFLFHGKEKLSHYNLEKQRYEKEAKLVLPELAGPREVSYDWNYKGKKYSLKITLYQSTYDYYRRQSKALVYYLDQLPEDADWKEKYHGLFLRIAENDTIFRQLAELVRREGEKQKLKEDEIAELALAFVQTIPYDDIRAKAILSSSEEETSENLTKYPYETLFEEKGICSDKTYLAWLIMRELGYGTSVFEYEKEKHLALGLQCPLEYSTHSTGYCYAETTTFGHRVGVVPQISDGKALPQKEIKPFEDEESVSFSQLLVTQPEVFQKKEGKTYSGVIRTFAIQNQLKDIEKKLAGLSGSLKAEKAEIEKMEKQLDDMERKLKKYSREGLYEKYNDLVSVYNRLLKDLRRKINDYNNKVKVYNSQVATYNKLIKEYSLFE